ncbi:MAG: hypothetical protein GX896_10660 [Clostridiales bacterium]|nr:hypothetical protein [Clostridiales bacterium]
MRKYIRAERANLFEPNVYISMVVKLSGNLSKEQLEKAVYNAYEANEATMCKIVLKSNGEAYYERLENSGCKFIHDTRHWKEMLYESECRPFKLMEGELIRTFVTEENDQIVLFIHAHHLVGDGQSVLILIQDIINSLCDKPLIYKPMLSVSRSFLNGKGKLALSIKLYIDLINKQWQKKRKYFTWNDYYKIHKNYWRNHSSVVITKTYDINELKKKCPKGITINSYIITKLLSNHQEYEVVGIPVSIREDAGMSNQTSGIAIKYKFNSKKSFEKNTNIIHRKIYKKIKNAKTKYFILLFMERLNPSLIDAVLLQSHGCYQSKLTEKIAEVMGYVGNNSRDLGVTNLNRINILNYSEEVVINDILFIPPKVSYAKQIVGISTHDDTLTMCYHKIKNSL